MAETAAASAEAPPPRANPDLFGHADAEAALRRLFRSGRMPHALLVSGPRGIGKATLAFRFARFALAGASEAVEEGLAVLPQSGVFRRVAAGGHADLLTVERAYDPRRRRLRSEIVVDDTREIGGFLRLTAAEDGWRIVIVDGADAMNRNAANALLKILEEPPPRALLLLVSHSPGRLLPTIRSRCRRFPLAPLPPDIVRRLLQRYRPELDGMEADAAVALAAGSIGRALDLAQSDSIELYRKLLRLVSRPRGVDPVALYAFVDPLVRPEADDSYRMVEQLFADLLARLAREATGAGAAGKPAALGAEGAAIGRLAARAPAAHWAALHEEVGRGFARADALNLDRKQQLLGAFFAIERAAG